MAKALHLVCIEDTKIKKFIVYYEEFPSIVVQVDKLEDAPNKMGELITMIVDYQIRHGNIQHFKY